jgi:lipopolysaccharide export system permease protein
MKIITKYLGITIATYISLVVLLLLGLQLFIEVTREFHYVGMGYYGIWQLLAYVFLMLPSDVYQFFPMASLLGSVIALGLLASHSELIVMRTAGISLIDISLAVLKSSIILVIFMLIVGEIVAPVTQKIASKNRAAAISKGQTLLTKQGIWIRSDNNFIHIDTVSEDKKLYGITKYEFDADNKLKTTSFAQLGTYQDKKWLCKNIVQTIFSAKQITNAVIPEQEWKLNLNHELLGMVHDDPDQKTLLQLYSYIKYRKLSGLNIASYEFIFWNRIFTPLLIVVMIMLAIPFVFGPLRSATMGLKMIVSIIIGFSFYILNQFAGSMTVVYQISPILTAILPTVLFSFVYGVFLAKTG